MRAEIKKIQELMEGADYVTDAAIATSVHLAMTLKKPLLIEGHAGVGKTEVAKVISRMLETNLIRLQCYEGLDAAQALYEWNYPKQLLHIKLEESTDHSLEQKEAAIFSEPFLIRLTSNRSRELSDALRRRCLYLWIDFPGFDKEVRIVMRKVPGVNERLARQISRFMENLRTIRLAKVPGVAETLDWAQALSSLHADHLDEDLVAETLGCVLKDADDVKRFKRELGTGGLKRFVPAEG
ncbi:MAG: ATPase [Candidatus Rokuibacteriota bacterium]|nr:MAG: ATPase [Candidatus Rokubacteria bacterium]